MRDHKHAVNSCGQVESLFREPVWNRLPLHCQSCSVRGSLICQRCLFFSCKISQIESWGLFLLHNKDFRNQRKRKKAEKHSVSDFQYYMITLRFPLFQSDQCVCVTPPALCRWLKNLIRQKLWQLEWIIQRSLGTETERLCGSSVFPHSLCCASSPQRITLHVFWSCGAGGTSAAYLSLLLCLFALTSA